MNNRIPIQEIPTDWMMALTPPGSWEEVGTDSAQKPYFNFETYEDIDQLPDKVWLIDHVLGEGDLTMDFGESGSGKTFLAFNKMMMLARGYGKFAGEFQVNRPAKTLYMTAEGRSGLAGRIRAAVKDFDLTPEEKNRCRFLRNVAQFVNDGAPSYYLHLLEDAEAQGFIPDVLFIDHLSSTLPGKGDSDQGASTLVAAAVAHIQDRWGCAIEFAHHTGYNKTHGRGMTNYKDILDMQLQVMETENPHRLRCIKNKDGPLWRDREFLISKVEGTGSCSIVWGGVADPRQDKEDARKDGLMAIMTEGPGMNQSQIVGFAVDRKVCSRSTTLSLLPVLIAEGRITTKPGGKKNAITYYPVI